jgi:hypothetical protein
MSDGLKRATDAAKGTRKGVCPACQREFTVRLLNGRIPNHGRGALLAAVFPDAAGDESTEG